MKRGMSPLMATALLITFAITFGIFAMALGNKIESLDNGHNVNVSSLCGDAVLDFLEVKDSPYLCIEGNHVQFIMVNNGRIDIESIQMIIVGQTIDVQNIGQTMKPHHLFQGSVEYDPERIGQIRELQFIPRVLASDGETPFLCVKNPIVFKDIQEC